MKLITVRSQIREVAARWREQYSPGSRTINGDTQEILRGLEALDVETATAEDVAKIIGNPSWVGHEQCHECGETFDTVIEVGQPPDYESHTAQLCLGCVAKVAQLAHSAGVERG